MVRIFNKRPPRINARSQVPVNTVVLTNGQTRSKQSYGKRAIYLSPISSRWHCHHQSHIMDYRSYTSVEIWNFSGRQNQSLYDKERSRGTFVIHSLKCSLISVKLRFIIFFFIIIIIGIITMIITFVML